MKASTQHVRVSTGGLELLKVVDDAVHLQQA
jgi:hypothetical protein